MTKGHNSKDDEKDESEPFNCKQALFKETTLGSHLTGFLSAQ
jgi:hypothetical protein